MMETWKRQVLIMDCECFPERNSGGSDLPHWKTRVPYTQTPNDAERHDEKARLEGRGRRRMKILDRLCNIFEVPLCVKIRRHGFAWFLLRLPTDLHSLPVVRQMESTTLDTSTLIKAANSVGMAREFIDHCVWVTSQDGLQRPIHEITRITGEQFLKKNQLDVYYVYLLPKAVTSILIKLGLVKAWHIIHRSNKFSNRKSALNNLGKLKQNNGKRYKHQINHV